MNAHEHYHRARAEHAFMLRLEGVPFREIAARLGVGRQHAYILEIRGGRYFAASLNRSFGLLNRRKLIAWHKILEKRRASVFDRSAN